MQYVITPGKAVGKLVFGMSVEQVRDIVGKPEKSIKVVPSDHFPQDYFEEGVTAHYDSSGKLDVVQFFGPDVYPLLDGQDLGDVTPKDWIKTVDPDAEVGDASFTSVKLSISFYDPPGIGLVVGVAKEGYYAA